MAMMFGGGAGFFGRADAPGERPLGIPTEMLDAADKLTANEPEHQRHVVEFDHANPVWDRPMSFRSLLAMRKGAVVFAVLMIGIETLCQQAGPKLIQYAIDHGITPGFAGTKGTDEAFRVVQAVTAIFVATAVVAVLAGMARMRVSGRAAEDILYRLRVAIFTQIQRLSLDFFGREKAGVIMTRMTSDVENVEVLVQEGLAQLVAQSAILVVVTGILFSMNVQLAAVTIFVIVPVLLAVTWWYRGASDRGFLAARDRVGEVLSDLQENLSGIRVVAAYNRQRRNSSRHRDVVGAYRDSNYYTARNTAIYGPSTESLGIVAQAVLIVVGGRMVLSGDLSLGALFAFVIYLNSFFMPIQQLTQLYTQYQQGKAAVTKLRELFSLEPTVVEQTDAVALAEMQGRIELDHVDFGYLPGVPVLRDVSLTIEAGLTVAFVGPTGAGKSTIAKLLTRFYDPQSGRVLVDGHDLRDVTLASLRNQLGVVPQLGFLFGGTVRDNIAFSKPDVTDEEILAACDAVGVRDLIERLPEGLDTLCHERGVTISAGERQLIALARAMVAKPRILVLDEATSNLDLATEAKIEKALDVLLDGRTAILIAHRLNTAMRADKIVVVDHGSIAVGTHDELLVGGGTYARLHEAWTRRADDDHVPTGGAPSGS